MTSEHLGKPAPAFRQDKEAVRAISRAVIGRVRGESPESSGYELFLRLWAAYPFGSADTEIQQIWHDEVLAVVGKLEAPPGQTLPAPGRLFLAGSDLLQ